LGRFEIFWRPLSNIYLEAGRVRFNDPAGFIAAGLFDGLSGTFVPGGVRLSAGAFYTGFLYKETAKILMSGGDAEKYAEPLDYKDPESFLASRRILVSTAAEFPDFSPVSTLALSAASRILPSIFWFDCFPTLPWINPASPRLS
jgi:hypothetical protein